MMIVVTVQVVENYGSPEEPYWKMKGGQDYKVLDAPEGLTPSQVFELLKACDIIGNWEMYSETPVGISYEDDDYMTDFERSQLEYDGTVKFPAECFQYSDLVNQYLQKIDETYVQKMEVDV